MSGGAGRLEFERTKEVVLRHLSPPPRSVADIGGGPGAYALWLASLGYTVEHRDLFEPHEAVRVRVEQGLRITTAVCDARSLDLPDACVDAALLLGPLYHLADRQDRVQALREVGRVLLPGGVAFVAAISRWSPRLDGVLAKKVYEPFPEALELVGEVERSGLLPPLFPGSFCGYVHRPRQLREEVRAGGLETLDLVALEGPSALLPDLDARLDDPVDREVLLGSLRAIERVPELLGATPHMLAVARRP